MNRYVIKLSYDGTYYSGWQSQPNASTVQSVLEEKLTFKLGHHIALTGCGRTDAGVHARNYVAHFDTKVNIDPQEFLFLINKMLPWDIVIHEIFLVDLDFHARFSPIEREYKYYVGSQKDVWNRNYKFYVYGIMDLDAMNKACKYLIGEQDFACFCRSGSNQHTTICNVSQAHWELIGDTYVFTIVANRFLRNMVRAVVGTLLAVGQEKMHFSEMQGILDSKNRSMAKKSAPAKGLFLNRIQYDLDCLNNS